MICAPVNEPSRKNRIGSIGCFTRSSAITNAISAIAAPASSAMIRVERPAVLVAAQEREHEQAEAGGQRDLAGPVDAVGGRVARLLHEAAGDREAGDADRDVDQEDPLPVEAAGEQAADERADRERRADRGAVGGERAGALLRGRERLREQRQRDREHDRGADALDRAGGVEEDDVGRQGACTRGDGEDREADREEAAAAEAVGERAGGQHDAGQRERVGVDDPLQAARGPCRGPRRCATAPCSRRRCRASASRWPRRPPQASSVAL